ncbi:hypothetical protein ACWGH8_00440 [Nonomuraea muscovyensis]|jgi:hypothetical protein|nr:hypothetical protein [Nonomuraea muscovyensis]
MTHAATTPAAGPAIRRAPGDTPAPRRRPGAAPHEHGTGRPPLAGQAR